MFKKIDKPLKFNNKRDRSLITPCCGKKNLDGKFVTYIDHSNDFGFCHSCGSKVLPPTLYNNEKGEEFKWNSITNKFEPFVLQLSHNHVIQSCNTNVTHSLKKNKYIDFHIVKRMLDFPKENNLLKYLRTIHNNNAIDKAKKMYYIGTNNKLWTIFWYINVNGKAQKAKAIFYTKDGKRTDYFKVPYKNENGYHTCLFGEHLLKNNSKPIILTESEKTAVIASIMLPHYAWLSYSGINGLTTPKIAALANQSIIIIPDFSQNAIDIIKKKIPIMKNYNIDAKIFDMRNKKNDEELKKTGWYNCDLEDVFRGLVESTKYKLYKL